MTTLSVLRASVRRWYVVLAVLGLAVLVALHIDRKPVTYWAQTDVVFLIPQSARYPNTIVDSSSSAIAMAGVVAADLNRGQQGPATASAGTNLAGEGVTDGSQIQVPNTGGQWAKNFDRPVISVQVVAQDPGVVKRRTDAVVERIRDDLRERQMRDGVRASDSMTISTSPSSTVVFALPGKRRLAEATVLLMGGSLGILTAVTLDRILVRRAAQTTRARISPAAGARPA